MVGFTEQQLKLPEGSRKQVCVGIQDSVTNADIYPAINIPLSITVENLTSVEGINTLFFCEIF